MTPLFEQQIDHKAALTSDRLGAALVDASDSLAYLRTMRDERAAIYETIVALLREAVNER